MELLLAGLTLAVALQSSAGGQAGRISGVVIEEGTNLPVSGARVVIVPLDEPPPREGYYPAIDTDQEGRFTFDKVTPRRYRIDASKRGFAPPLPGSARAVVDLGPGEELTNVTIVLNRGGVITGRILDPSGHPLSGMRADVLLRRFETAGGALSSDPQSGPLALLHYGGGSATNERGEFRVEVLPPGEYVVAARRSQGSATQSFNPTFYPSTLDRSAAQIVTVTSGRTVADITVRLVATFRVSGLITDENGEPVSAQLRLLPAPPDAPCAICERVGANSDARGTFTLQDIPSGSYTLIASVSHAGPAGEVAITVKGADVLNVKVVVER